MVLNEREVFRLLKNAQSSAAHHQLKMYTLFMPEIDGFPLPVPASLPLGRKQTMHSSARCEHKNSPLQGRNIKIPPKHIVWTRWRHGMMRPKLDNSPLAPNHPMHIPPTQLLL
mmetsp:Transcript_9856/g.36758  ORF Transcript_9856/g.36758 Transcript_9856/m.36758 type:complete len:113 (-) Transcript_9856:1064-1402(-)